MHRLAEAIRELDAPTRALLDLSIRRQIRDDAMAPMLRTDPFHLAWRRARALERIAAAIADDEDFLALGAVRAALTQLPDDAWLTPALPAPDAPVAELPVSAPAPVRPRPRAEPPVVPAPAPWIEPEGRDENPLPPPSRAVALVPVTEGLVVLRGQTLELNLPEPLLHALERSRELAAYVRSEAAAPVRRNAIVAAIAAFFGLLVGRRRRRR